MNLIKSSFLTKARHLALMLPCAAILGCDSPAVELTETERVAEMQWFIDKFDHNYAPLAYKQQRFNFDWEAKKQDFLALAKTAQNNAELTNSIGDLVGLFQDAHTGFLNLYMLLPGTMKVAYLGFLGARLSENGTDYLLVQNMLPTFKHSPISYPVKIGDKISKINNQPVIDYVLGRCSRRLGQIESDKTAFVPMAALMDSVDCRIPEDSSVTLEIVDALGTTKIVELPLIVQDYLEFIDEQLAAAGPLDSSSHSQEGEVSEQSPIPKSISRRTMPVNLNQYIERLQKSFANQGLAARQDDFSIKFIDTKMLAAPILAAESEAIKPESSLTQNYMTVENSHFDVRVYPSEQGNVGYIKIVDFGGYDDYVEAFNLALTDLKTFATKALVIDLVDNGGGSLDYGLKLAELLKASNATDPKLEVRLNDNWINSYISATYWAPSPAHREIAKRHLAELRADLAAGKRLSRPMDFRRSFDPPTSPTNSEATQVVLMVNEMCASMCDIFAADLKDSGIAKIIGTRTMGAGGNVAIHMSSPRLQLGLTQTESMVVRANGTYVENNGVEVDRRYVRTKRDLFQNDINFIKAAVDYAVEN